MLYFNQVLTSFDTFMPKRNLSFFAVVQYIGSQKKTAELLGCTLGCVNQVVNGRIPMPDSWAPKLEALTKGKFKAEELAPNSPWVTFRTKN